MVFASRFFGLLMAIFVTEESTNVGITTVMMGYAML